MEYANAVYHVTAHGNERKPTCLPTGRSIAMIATGSGFWKRWAKAVSALSW